MSTQPLALLPPPELLSEDSTNDTDSELFTTPNKLQPKPGRAVATVFPNNAQPYERNGENSGVSTPTEDERLPELSSNFDIPISAFEADGPENEVSMISPVSKITSNKYNVFISAHNLMQSNDRNCANI